MERPKISYYRRYYRLQMQLTLTMNAANLISRNTCDKEFNLICFICL
jgi:hypothetical protein